MARSKKFYAVCIQMKKGNLITEVCKAYNAGDALGQILDAHHAGHEPDCEWVLVRSEMANAEDSPKKAAPKPRARKRPEVISALPLTDAQTDRAAKAVKRLVADGVEPGLLPGIIDAYALGVAEGP